MLTYGPKAIIHVKVEELNYKMTHTLSEEDNVKAIREEVDLLEEDMTTTALMSAIVKQAINFFTLIF